MEDTPADLFLSCLADMVVLPEPRWYASAIRIPRRIPRETSGSHGSRREGGFFESDRLDRRDR